MWLGITNNNRLNHLNSLLDQPGRKTIIIRNQDDPFTTPDLKNIIKYPNLKFIELKGVHDEYYANPKPYIDLLSKEL